MSARRDVGPSEGREGRTPPAGAGLCGVCLHGRLVVSGKGSRFLLCERSRDDPRYPRYPSLPVLRCEGFEAQPST